MLHKENKRDCMEKLVITTAENNRLAVDLVRYFSFKSNQYLVYTLNEYDEKNYIQLYVMLVMEELGELIARPMNDEDWSEMKNIIKKILKEIKSGKKKFLLDLDYDPLSNIKIANPRHFKLDRKLVDLLSTGYAFSNSKNEEDNFSPSILSNEIDSNNAELESIDETISKAGNFHSRLSDTLNNSNVINPDFVQAVHNDGNPNLGCQEPTINYKELYLTFKAQNEASSELINQMMLQLALYKEKFGELDN